MAVQILLLALASRFFLIGLVYISTHGDLSTFIVEDTPRYIGYGELIAAGAWPSPCAPG